jgi:hypothetical protein
MYQVCSVVARRLGAAPSFIAYEREGERDEGGAGARVVGVEAARLWKLVGVQAGDTTIGRIKVDLLGKKE